MEAKAAESEKKKADVLAAAKSDAAKFASEREAKIAAAKSTNRSTEKTFLDSRQATNASDNMWEKVVSWVDLKDKADRRDVSRMRSVMLQLKNSA